MALSTAGGRPPLLFSSTAQQEAKSTLLWDCNPGLPMACLVLPNLETGTTGAKSSPVKRVVKRRRRPHAQMKYDQSDSKDDRAALVPLTAHFPPHIKML